MKIGIRIGVTNPQPDPQPVNESDMSTAEILARRRALFQVEEDRDPVTRALIHTEEHIRDAVELVRDVTSIPGAIIRGFQDKER